MKKKLESKKKKGRGERKRKTRVYRCMDKRMSEKNTRKMLRKGTGETTTGVKEPN